MCVVVPKTEKNIEIESSMFVKINVGSHYFMCTHLFMCGFGEQHSPTLTFAKKKMYF